MQNPDAYKQIIGIRPKTCTGVFQADVYSSNSLRFVCAYVLELRAATER